MAKGNVGRPRNAVPSVRLRFGDGFIQLGKDPALDALYEKIQSMPRGTKFKTITTWLITGAMMEVALPPDEVDLMKRAAEEIMANFVVDS